MDQPEPVAEEPAVDEAAMCGRFGCQEPAAPLHPCPYGAEINGDHATLCRCCLDCEQECADDI